jgi:nucleotide-binding universal stress UspA family protein
MYTRILVPLDGSKTAEAVLPYARVLVSDLKVPVELLTVIDVAELSKHVPAERLTNFDEVIKGQGLNAKGYLGEVAKTFQGENVRCTVEQGAAAGNIINKAGTDKSTLIAMATHGRSGLSRWLLGSIAEKVLRAANNPLLLIRANKEASTDGRATLASVTVPLDGSKLAESILPQVVELANAIKLRVRLMRTYSVADTISRYEAYSSGFEALSAKSKSQVSSYLDEKVEQLKNEGLIDVVSLASEGKPAEMIIEAMRGAQNGLIAMCTHGRSGVNRWLLGSVTEKVVRHSGNPVLVVRAT